MKNYINHAFSDNALVLILESGWLTDREIMYII